MVFTDADGVLVGLSWEFNSHHQHPPFDPHHVGVIRKAVAEVADRDGFERVLVEVGRNAGPWLLDLWWDHMTHFDHLRYLPDVWGMAEYPTRALPEDVWIGRFHSVGYCTDIDPDLREDLPEWWKNGPSQPVEVFRGAPITSGAIGMSWTLDHQVAQFFVNRWQALGVKAEVYQTEVAPDAVLAFIHSRPEFEVVVDPYLVNPT